MIGVIPAKPERPNRQCQRENIAMGRNMTFAIKAVKTAFELED